MGEFGGKFLRLILDPVRVGENFCIRTNKELKDLLNNIVVVQRIHIQRLSRLCHVARMEENVLAKRVFDAGISGRRRRERLYPRWKDQMVEIIILFSVVSN